MTQETRKRAPSRCDHCGTKTKPGSQFEYMCRNSAACKRRAAPRELLAAAKDALAFLEGMKRDSEQDVTFKAFENPLRAAIRLAEGK